MTDRELVVLALTMLRDSSYVEVMNANTTIDADPNEIRDAVDGLLTRFGAILNHEQADFLFLEECVTSDRTPPGLFNALGEAHAARRGEMWEPIEEER